MASIRKAGRKSWQCDYHEPVRETQTFQTEKEARRFLGRIQKKDPVLRETKEGFTVEYLGKKRVRFNMKGTRKEAEAELSKRVSLIAEAPRMFLEKREKRSYLFQELVDRYREHYGDQVAYRTGKEHHVTLLEAEFQGRTLDSITYYDCQTYKLTRSRTPIKHGTPRTKSTLNKEVGCLRHMLNKAIEWGMLKQSPMSQGKPLQEAENNKRFRYLNEEEISALLQECSAYLGDVVVVAVNTGMRRGELLSLRWGQVKDGFIYLQKTKTNRERVIPINQAVNEVLKRRRQKIGFASPFVFCHESHRANKRGISLVNEAYADLKKGFRAACQRAGIEDVRFHDLRHTFASHLVMRGASLKEVQELLGHANLTMTLRYAHLSQEAKVNAVNSLDGLTGTMTK
jgi:integrase